LGEIEVVLLRELHAARCGKFAVCLPKVGAGQLGVDGRWVKSYRIGGVVSFPRKLGRSVFTQLPGLGKPSIEIKIAITAEPIAFVGFAWVGLPNRRTIQNPGIDGLRLSNNPGFPPE
jgi:hypothetical protein